MRERMHTAFLKPDEDSSSDSSEDEHEQAPVPTATATVSDASIADDCCEVCLVARWCRVDTHVSVKAAPTELLIWQQDVPRLCDFFRERQNV